MPLVTGWMYLLHQTSVQLVRIEKASHKAKLAGMEELETEHVGDEDISDEGAQLPEKTDPLPLTILPIGL